MRRNISHIQLFQSIIHIRFTKIAVNTSITSDDNDDVGVDVVNVGIPIPLMLPKNAIISTQVIVKQCEMILSPYLKSWKNQNLNPYELYILTKNTVYCGVCADNAFCRGCKLSKYQQISTGDLDFIISIRWMDEDSFNSFDQTVFTLSKNQNQMQNISL